MIALPDPPKIGGAVAAITGAPGRLVGRKSLRYAVEPRLLFPGQKPRPLSDQKLPAVPTAGHSIRHRGNRLRGPDKDPFAPWMRAHIFRFLLASRSRGRRVGHPLTNAWRPAAPSGEARAATEKRREVNRGNRWIRFLAAPRSPTLYVCTHSLTVPSIPLEIFPESQSTACGRTPGRTVCAPHGRGAFRACRHETTLLPVCATPAVGRMSTACGRTPGRSLVAAQLLLPLTRHQPSSGFCATISHRVRRSMASPSSWKNRLRVITATRILHPLGAKPRFFRFLRCR